MHDMNLFSATNHRGMDVLTIPCIEFTGSTGGRDSSSSRNLRAGTLVCHAPLCSRLDIGNHVSSKQKEDIQIEEHCPLPGFCATVKALFDSS